MPKKSPAKKYPAPRGEKPFSKLHHKTLPSADEFLAKLPLSQRRIADVLRSIIRRAVPRAREAVKPQRKLLSYHAPHYFCFLFPRGDSVHLGFEWGERLSDPKMQLKGEGDYSSVRFLTFTDVRQIDSKELASIIREAANPALKGTSKMPSPGQRAKGQ